MTPKERNELRIAQYRQVVNALVNDPVSWSRAQWVSRIATDRPCPTRIALLEKPQPLVLAHDAETGHVGIYTPDEAADWAWEAVSEFPGLGSFLCKHVDTSRPVSVHCPTGAWLRRVIEVGQGSFRIEER